MIDVVRAVEAWRPRGVGSPESFIVRVPEEHLQHEFERRAGYHFSAGFPAPRIVEVPADVYPDGDVVGVAKKRSKGSPTGRGDGCFATASMAWGMSCNLRQAGRSTRAT